jgi:hypothetical protein
MYYRVHFIGKSFGLQSYVFESPIIFKPISAFFKFSDCQKLSYGKICKVGGVVLFRWRVSLKSCLPNTACTDERGSQGRKENW